MFRFLRPSVKFRALSSRLGSLILLFQRSPLVQILFPEARILGGAGLGKITQWTIATVAGLGAYDSVAGATAIDQLAPDAGTTTVPAANGSSLSFVFQLTNYPSTPGSWSVTGLPPGLVHTNAKNNTVDSISGIPTQSGSFTVKITAHANTNFTGSSYSADFTIKVGSPIISTQPTSTLVVSGDNATLSVTGSGNGLTYQWYRGSSPNTNNLLSGKTSANFTTPALTSSTNYWVQVTRSNGVSANSNTATVTIGTPPAITNQPDSITINPDSTATLTVASSGTSPSLQWYRGASGVTTNPISGATSTSFTTPNLASTTSYWVRVSNALGSANSAAATVTVRTVPSITTQPLPITIDSGNTGNLSVMASGTSPTFQWYLGTSSDITNPILGATSGSFTTPPLAVSTSYWVRATNPAGTADSNTATVTVNDPFVTWRNNQFSAQDIADPLVSGPTADPDGDGITNAAEYIFGSVPLVAEPSPSPVVSVSGNQTSLSFTAKAASGPGYSGLTRHYAIETTDTLDSASWLPIAGYSDIVATGQSVNYQAAATGPHQFYRLTVSLKP